MKNVPVNLMRKLFNQIKYCSIKLVYLRVRIFRLRDGRALDNIIENQLTTFKLQKFQNYLLKVLSKGTFLLEDTDVFVITPNRRIFFLTETESLNFEFWRLCLEIEDILKFESLEACNGKKAVFDWLRQP